MLNINVNDAKGGTDRLAPFGTILVWIEPDATSLVGDCKVKAADGKLVNAKTERGLRAAAARIGCAVDQRLYVPEQAEVDMNTNEEAALRRLIEIAKRDTGQSRRVADFLLAWWNAAECGGFDLTNLFSVDGSIASDMMTVFALIARVHRYPDTLGFGKDFQAIVLEWRPELVAA